MIQVVLFEPENPPNTGNIIRLCANTGAALHLVRPLGFQLTARNLARAGLDYHDLANVTVHDNWEACRTRLAHCRWFALSTKGTTRYDQAELSGTCALLFGPESRGLPQSVLEHVAPEDRLRIPMQRSSRSLNLANAVSVLVFEAWRQTSFAGGA